VNTNNLFCLYKANRKSGNNEGNVILSLFRRLLNPAQVVDLAERPPEAALEWCSLLGEVQATILVAGGDGTVGWVLNAVNKLQLKVGTYSTVNGVTCSNNHNFCKISVCENSLKLWSSVAVYHISEWRSWYNNWYCTTEEIM
jgi:hypothetical protein